MLNIHSGAGVFQEHLNSNAAAAIKLAAGAEGFKGSEHAYLPKTIDEVMSFTPHAWVEQAVKMAYLQGAKDATSGALSVTDEELSEVALLVAMGAAI